MNESGAWSFISAHSSCWLSVPSCSEAFSFWSSFICIDCFLSLTFSSWDIFSGVVFETISFLSTSKLFFASLLISEDSEDSDSSLSDFTVLSSVSFCSITDSFLLCSFSVESVLSSSFSFTSIMFCSSWIFSTFSSFSLVSSISFSLNSFSLLSSFSCWSSGE